LLLRLPALRLGSRKAVTHKKAQQQPGFLLITKAI